MDKKPLRINHVDGRVEVTLMDGHGSKASPLSGTLVLGKPSDFDDKSEQEIRDALPPLGVVKVDPSAGGDAKPKKTKRKK